DGKENQRADRTDDVLRTDAARLWQGHGLLAGDLRALLDHGLVEALEAHIAVDDRAFPDGYLPRHHAHVADNTAVDPHGIAVDLGAAACRAGEDHFGTGNPHRPAHFRLRPDQHTGTGSAELVAHLGVDAHSRTGGIEMTGGRT